MSKGYAVYPLMRQPREMVINENLIRECIYLSPARTTDEERLRFVSVREEQQRQQRVRAAVETMELHRVTTLLLSYRRIGKIENLCGLGNLTKLALDNNNISVIQGIDKLHKLQWLDLSFNEITEINGLTELQELETLSLFSNKISVIQGLETLQKLTSLSIGNNCIEGLEETARYLHRIPSLRILTLKGNKIEKQPLYRVRILAFIQTLQFLDGRVVDSDEITQAREEQRENLVPIDEEDERLAAEKKIREEDEKTRSDYARFNCPDETKFHNELFSLEKDVRGCADLLRADAATSSSKELLEKFETEFNEKAKELAESMKAIRQRRDNDQKVFCEVVEGYKQRNAENSKKIIKQFEKELKAYVPRALWGQGGDVYDGNIPEEALSELRRRLKEVQHQLLELEADQFDAVESLNIGTISKWKSDNVDVIIPSAFEYFLKMETDFQVNLRQIFDSIYEQRQKQELSPDAFLLGKQDEGMFAIIDNREECQKILGDWFELRRKRLEDLEQMYLKNEEKLISERSTQILQEEQARHRIRLNEIHEFVEQMRNVLDRRN